MDRRDETPPRAKARGGPLTRDPALPPTLLGVIAAQVAARPDRRIWSLSAQDPFPSRTHGFLWDRSARLAAGLAGAGAVEGRAVVLLIRDVLDFVPAVWACLRIGGMVVPLTGLAGSSALGRDDAALREALARLDAPVILHDDTFADWAAAAREGLPAGTLVLPLAPCEAAAPFAGERPCPDPCCLVATSGSTGRFKLVGLSQETILNRFHSARPKAPAAVVYLSSLPIDGISGIAVAFHLNREVVHVDLADFASRPLRVLDAIETLRVTHGLMTSSFAAYLLKAAERDPRAQGARDLGSLSMMGFGAEPVVPAVMRRLRDLFARNGAGQAKLVAGYGTTETGGLVEGAEQGLAPADADAAPADLGNAAVGVELRVVAPEGANLAEGDLGEVEALCPQTLFSGYWGEPEATRAAFTADGWYRTGDLGTLVGGRLTLRGRAKDVLIANGRKLSLAEIDAALQAGLALAVPAHACAVHWPGEEAERLVVVLVADAAEPGRLEALAEEAGRIVARRFGLAPGRILAAAPAAIPLTGAGKIRRRDLAEEIRSGRIGTVLRPASARGQGPVGAAPPPPEAGVPAIWRAVLDLRGPLDPQANFFDLGGDSLRALALATRIGETYGGWIAPEAFFAEPTLATLVRLVAEIGAPAAVPARASAEAPLPWPLPDDLRRRQLSLLETWDGTRPTRDRLVAGLNVEGAAPPLFWVFQSATEFRQLARHLGPGQPLYGLRSGSRLIRYDEDEIQLLALRYVHEIAEACPEGPVFVGGNCQGALIALAVAQHLLRRGRHVPLLVLMEWGFAPQPYGGRVLHLYGRDSLVGNPYRRYGEPERVWWRLYREYRRAEIPGGHGEFFRDENVGGLARALGDAMRRAHAEPPVVPVRDAHRVDLAVSGVPPRLRPGEACTLTVTLRNAGPFSWDGDAFGLGLRSVWLGEDGETVAMARGADLPLPLRPGETAGLGLVVTAPDVPGAYQLLLDLVDEGWTWAVSRHAPFRQAVTVAP